jgi:hypothetical protein
VTATPGSYQSLLMSPHRGQIAGTKCKKFIVTTSGHKVPIAALNSEYRKLIDERGIDPTSIDQASLPELPQKT